MIPSDSTTGRDGEPRLDLVGNHRSVHFVYKSSSAIIAYEDNWRTPDPSWRRRELWAERLLRQEAVRPQTSNPGGLRLPHLQGE